MLESINRCHTEAGPFVTGLAILFYFFLLVMLGGMGPTKALGLISIFLNILIKFFTKQE